jgi:hypothetical protein
MPIDIFESCVRQAGDLAGVFEYDGQTGYFYLYEIGRDSVSDNRILDWIHILSTEPDFSKSEISVRWDSVELKVGLFIRNMLWAVFDTSSAQKHGGNYRSGAHSLIPYEATTGFGTIH